MLSPEILPFSLWAFKVWSHLPHVKRDQTWPEPWHTLQIFIRHENHSFFSEIRHFETKIGDLRESCRSNEKKNIFWGGGMDRTWRYTRDYQWTANMCTPEGNLEFDKNNFSKISTTQVRCILCQKENEFVFKIRALHCTTSEFRTGLQ